MTASDVELRLIQAADELSPVLDLVGEYEEWVRARVLADYGIDFEFKSERDLFLDLDGLLEPRARLYIAEINREPVGIGGLRPLAAHEAEIKRMYVRPSSRGLGVGRAILQRLIDDARALGYRTIRLDSARFMHEAHALYRRFGFVPSSPHTWEFESMPALRETAVFMRLDLGPDQSIAASRSAYSEDSPDSAASRKTRDAMNFTSSLAEGRRPSSPRVCG